MHNVSIGKSGILWKKRSEIIAHRKSDDIIIIITKYRQIVASNITNSNYILFKWTHSIRSNLIVCIFCDTGTLSVVGAHRSYMPMYVACVCIPNKWTDFILLWFFVNKIRDLFAGTCSMWFMLVRAIDRLIKYFRFYKLPLFSIWIVRSSNHFDVVVCVFFNIADTFLACIEIYEIFLNCFHMGTAPSSIYYTCLDCMQNLNNSANYPILRRKLFFLSIFCENAILDFNLISAAVFVSTTRPQT